MTAAPQDEYYAEASQFTPVSGARVPRSGKTATPSQPPRGGVASPSPSPAESLPAGEAPSSSLTDVTVPSTIRRGAAEQSPARGVRGADSVPLAGPENLSDEVRRTGLTAGRGYVRLYSRDGGMAHLAPAGGVGSRAVLCNRIPAWPDEWLGVSSAVERSRAAELPVCKQCLSVIATANRGGRPKAPRKPRKVLEPVPVAAGSRAAPAAELSTSLDRRTREPGMVIIPGPAPFLSQASDDAAAFVLKREQWDLPLVARFTIDGEPVSKARARFTNRGSKAKAYTPDNTLRAEEAIGWKFRAVAPEHELDPEASYGVVALFFCGTRQRRDVDNMLKLVLDGLNQVAWPDDSQVTEVSARKNLTLPEHARTEVAVYRIGSVQRFTDNCAHCGHSFPVFKCTSGRRRYCSSACAVAARRQSLQQVTCEGCGTLFAGTEKRRYCSAECRYSNGRGAVTCTGCGTEFTKQKCHVRAVNYCSAACRDAANREHKQLLAKGACETCGGPTSKKSYRECRACRNAGSGVTGTPEVSLPPVPAAGDSTAPRRRAGVA